jgi:hypothetical protein
VAAEPVVVKVAVVVQAVAAEPVVVKAERAAVAVDRAASASVLSVATRNLIAPGNRASRWSAPSVEPP